LRWSDLLFDKPVLAINDRDALKATGITVIVHLIQNARRVN
jgi:hypothetical protein